MKRLSGYAVILIVLSSILVFDGCKRGDDDPFFSIRSRKARVTGDWAIETMERNVTQLLNDGTTAKINFKVGNDKIAEIVDSVNTSHDTVVTTNGVVKDNKYSFDKNSKMEYLFHYEMSKLWTEIDEATNIITYNKMVYTYLERAAGSWNFISNIEKHGVNKYKNKERLSLIFESNNITQTTVLTFWQVDENGITLPGNTFNTFVTSSERKYSNGEFAQIWVLKELRDKKIVMERNIDDVVQTATITNGSSTTGNSYSEKGFETVSLKPRL
jgi:hypothetical protein